MSEAAQAKAAAAAQCASEAITALLEYSRHGGTIDGATRHDCVYPLADAVRLALEAVNDRADRLDAADNGLLNEVQAWLAAGSEHWG